MSQERSMGNFRPGKSKHQVPWLEWLAANVGLLLFLALFGAIGWQAFNRAASPPAVTVEVEDVQPVERGYRVLFRARNSSDEAAAQVEIVGKVSAPNAEVETSRVILDYIPGHSAKRGGLFFTHAPHSGALAVRATGFAEP